MAVSDEAAGPICISSAICQARMVPSHVSRAALRASAASDGAPRVTADHPSVALCMASAWSRASVREGATTSCQRSCKTSVVRSCTSGVVSSEFGASRQLVHRGAPEKAPTVRTPISSHDEARALVRPTGVRFTVGCPSNGPAGPECPVAEAASH